MARSDADLRRELEKIRDVLEVVDRHFNHEAEMNAALHMSSIVRPAPLALAVTGAFADIIRLIGEFDYPAPRERDRLCVYKDRDTGAVCGRPEESPVHPGPDEPMGHGKHVYRNA